MYKPGDIVLVDFEDREYGRIVAPGIIKYHFKAVDDYGVSLLILGKKSGVRAEWQVRGKHIKGKFGEAYTENMPESNWLVDYLGN